MKIVVFGLTISSSWGNGHATLWRGLCRALARRNHYVVFYERDVPYYAGARDLAEMPGGKLILYPEWGAVASCAKADVADADVAIVTSYCPDGIAAAEIVTSDPKTLSVFYDLDTPVTLSRIRRGEKLDYIGPRRLVDFDLVLSFTGGAALSELRDRMGARLAVPLYGHVDPDVHHPTPNIPQYAADLSYLGTFAMDRQAQLERLFIEPARRRPEGRFLIGGAQYPQDFPWSDNTYFVRHLPPAEHPAFFSSSRLTLNVTRADMARMGWCPSGRLFEAAACGTPVLSDCWEGLESFFRPGEEVLLARDTDDTLAALDLDPSELRAIGQRARERVLDEHTSESRVATLLEALELARATRHEPAPVAMSA